MDTKHKIRIAAGVILVSIPFLFIWGSIIYDFQDFYKGTIVFLEAIGITAIVFGLVSAGVILLSKDY